MGKNSVEKSYVLNNYIKICFLALRDIIFKRTILIYIIVLGCGIDISEIELAFLYKVI